MLGRRTHRHSRRIIDPTPWLPTQIDPANLVLWQHTYSTATDVTRSSASMSNDPTTFGKNPGGMTLVTASGQDPIGGNGAVLWTDSVDGAPVQHFVNTSPTNAQLGVLALRFWAKAGTKQWYFVQTGASVGVYVNTATGAIGNLIGAGSAGRLVQQFGPWFQFHVESTIAGSAQPTWTIAPSNGSVSYQGDGTGTIYLGGGATYGPTYLQDRVSQWNDRSGLGNHGTQGTAANQELLQCRDAAGNWVPFNDPSAASCDIGWPAEAASKNLGYSSLHTRFSGLNKPMTLIEIRKVISVPATSPTGGLRFQGATADMQLLNNRNADDFIDNRVADGPTGAKFITKGPLNAGSYCSIATVFDGTNGVVWVNGTASAPTDLTGTYTLTSAVWSAFNAMRREKILYSSALSPVDFKRAYNGARMRAGMPPV